MSNPKRPEWAVIKRMRRGTLKMFPHDHDLATADRKCPTHQTLAANAKLHGLTLHVFHDNRYRLWVARLPE